jgi:hypothetical protein
MFVLIDSPQSRQPVPSANSIYSGPSGRYTAQGGYSFAEGTVGADVSGVTLHQDGLDVVATVDHGRWTAWWPNLDSDLDGATIYGTFEVVTTGGESYSYSAAEVALP